MRVRESLLLARNGIGPGVGSSLLKGNGYKWEYGRVNRAICCCCLRLATSKVDVENCGRRLMFGLKKLNLCKLHREILEWSTRNDDLDIRRKRSAAPRSTIEHFGVKDAILLARHVNWRPQVLILYRIQKDQQAR